MGAISSARFVLAGPVLEDGALISASAKNLRPAWDKQRARAAICQIKIILERVAVNLVYGLRP